VSREARGLSLRALAPLYVAAYICTHRGSVPTVKHHLAAIRVLCDWLVVSQILPTNPAGAVRGPKHIVTTGTTPVLTAGETRLLLDRISTGTIVGLRDRALIGVMAYSFARVSAVVGMRRRITSRKESGGGCASTRKAASGTPSRPIIWRRPTWMRIWRPAPWSISRPRSFRVSIGRGG
jgi:site-specific recombinase XerD